MELVLDRVTKQYKNKIAVDRLSASMEKGVYGLLGANGAGKTTLMRMVCGIAEITSGEIRLGGEQIGAMGARYRDGVGIYAVYRFFKGTKKKLCKGAKQISSAAGRTFQ